MECFVNFCLNAVCLDLFVSELSTEQQYFSTWTTMCLTCFKAVTLWHRCLSVFRSSVAVKLSKYDAPEIPFYPAGHQYETKVCECGNHPIKFEGKAPTPGRLCLCEYLFFIAVHH